MLYLDLIKCLFYFCKLLQFIGIEKRIYEHTTLLEFQGICMSIVLVVPKSISLFCYKIVHSLLYT
jgi:hypothetical protein